MKKWIREFALVLALISLLAGCNARVNMPSPGSEPDKSNAHSGTINDPNTVPLQPGYEPLVFNSLVSGGMMSFSPAEWPVAFSYGLSQEQYSAAFSGLNLTLNAQANYAKDGTLIDVTAASDDQNRINIHVVVDKRSIGNTMVHVDQENNQFTDSMVTSQVHGVTVTARIIDEQFSFSKLADGEMYFDAWFDLRGFRHIVSFNSTVDNGPLLMTNIVNGLILNGADWIRLLRETVIPELKDDLLTLDEARLDPDFGVYLPHTVPDGFIFEQSRRFQNQQYNFLYVEWRASPDYDYLYGLYSRWIASRGSDKGVWQFSEVFWPDNVIAWYVSIEKTIDNRIPVLAAENLTLDAVREHLEIRSNMSQVMYPDASGDTESEVHISYDCELFDFAVQIDDIFVNIRSEGVSVETVWALLEGIAW